ncbi:hypothetical protein LTR10_011998 [Elasticomyces elasticus]|nr:hypothetical protein LTR10_011998 [Elasticomyces elasticus]KAK4968940.1 hypothetical protein LTR42_009219 [Elasticomyces elasticus]
MSQQPPKHPKSSKSSSKSTSNPSQTSKTSKAPKQHDHAHKTKTEESPASDASLAACSHVAEAGFPLTQSTPQPLTEANLHELDAQNEARYGTGSWAQSIITTPSMEVVHHRRGETIIPALPNKNKNEKKK